MATSGVRRASATGGEDVRSARDGSTAPRVHRDGGRGSFVGRSGRSRELPHVAQLGGLSDLQSTHSRPQAGDGLNCKHPSTHKTLEWKLQ